MRAHKITSVLVLRVFVSLFFVLCEWIEWGKEGAGVNVYSPSVQCGHSGHRGCELRVKRDQREQSSTLCGLWTVDWCHVESTFFFSGILRIC